MLNCEKEERKKERKKEKGLCGIMVLFLYLSHLQYPTNEDN